MKRLVKLCCVVGIALGLLATAQAATYTKSFATNAWAGAQPTNTIVSNACMVLSVTIQNDAAAANTVMLMDSWTNSVTYTRIGYTNLISYMTNIATLGTQYVSMTGVWQTNQYWTNQAVLYTASNTVANATVEYPVLLSTVVPASTTVTWTNTLGIPCYWGLRMRTNTHACTLTVVYQPFK